MSLRYGACSTPTARAEYERRLTLAKQQIGPLPTTPGGRTALPADRHRRLAERLDALIAQAQAG